MKKQLIPLFFLAMVLYTKAIGKIGNNANPSLVTIDAICNASIQVELDASGIAQYAINIIDTLPQPEGFPGQGFFNVSNELFYQPGEILEIPIELQASLEIRH